jgi:hypothetical protein
MIVLFLRRFMNNSLCRIRIKRVWRDYPSPFSPTVVYHIFNFAFVYFYFVAFPEVALPAVGVPPDDGVVP